MLAAVFQSEDVADEVECADLAAAIGEQLVASHRTRLDLVNVFGRFFFAVDLSFSFVREFV